MDEYTKQNSAASNNRVSQKAFPLWLHSLMKPQNREDKKTEDEKDRSSPASSLAKHRSPRRVEFCQGVRALAETVRNDLALDKDWARIFEPKVPITWCNHSLLTSTLIIYQESSIWSYGQTPFGRKLPLTASYRTSCIDEETAREHQHDTNHYFFLRFGRSFESCCRKQYLHNIHGYAARPKASF